MDSRSATLKWWLTVHMWPAGCLFSHMNTWTAADFFFLFTVWSVFDLHTNHALIGCQWSWSCIDTLPTVGAQTDPPETIDVSKLKNIFSSWRDLQFFHRGFCFSIIWLYIKKEMVFLLYFLIYDVLSLLIRHSVLYVTKRCLHFDQRQ